MLSAWADKQAKHLAPPTAACGRGNQGAECQALHIADTGLYKCVCNPYPHEMYMDTKHTIKQSEYLANVNSLVGLGFFFVFVFLLKRWWKTNSSMQRGHTKIFYFQ